MTTTMKKWIVTQEPRASHRNHLIVRVLVVESATKREALKAARDTADFHFVQPAASGFKALEITELQMGRVYRL